MVRYITVGTRTASCEGRHASGSKPKEIKKLLDAFEDGGGDFAGGDGGLTRRYFVKPTKCSPNV